MFPQLLLLAMTLPALVFWRRSKKATKRLQPQLDAIAAVPGVPAQGPITIEVFRVGSQATYYDKRQMTPSVLTVSDGRVRLVHVEGKVWLDKPVDKVRVRFMTGYVMLGKFLGVSTFPPDERHKVTAEERVVAEHWLAHRLRLALAGKVPASYTPPACP
jgi:hypothetical protein